MEFHRYHALRNSRIRLRVRLDYHQGTYTFQPQFHESKEPGATTSTLSGDFDLLLMLTVTPGSDPVEVIQEFDVKAGHTYYFVDGILNSPGLMYSLEFDWDILPEED